ncbi:MAG TPA: sugar transferase [Planctomycetota bacterium]|nr:sugar transferase [Planctomycetota bacterium]
MTTVVESLGFLRGQIGFMRRQGFEVHAITSPGAVAAFLEPGDELQMHEVSMARRITPIEDLRALVALYREMCRLRPLIVHAHTPKGGLLGMIAARLAGVPIRIYHIRGLPFVTACGSRRRLLMTTERVSCRLAHRVLCVSRSVASVVRSSRICASSKLVVPANGSGNGVDAGGRFVPRTRGNGPRAIVLGFVGRIVRDKGIVELAKAWRTIRERSAHARLLIVGPREIEDPVPAEFLAELERDPRVEFAGSLTDIVSAYSSMDVLVHPSHREGFPNVLLEAAAMGLPVVATRIPGCIDAVEDGVTGMLCAVRDANALARATLTYIESPELRRRHGAAGRDRVLRSFRREVVWDAILSEYRSLIARWRPARHRASRGPSNSVVRFSQVVKRLVDVTVAATVLALSAPLFVLLSALIRRTMGSPVIFRQPRPGKSERLFTVFKFRTMRNQLGRDGRELSDAERLTPLGRFMRRYSLDELPQLWNVLRGDMSLVGPRPLLVRYLPHYSARERVRHTVRPGITGLAQVEGRNTLSWDRRLELDVEYVERWSLALDLLILARTVMKVVRREGVVDAPDTLMQNLDDERASRVHDTAPQTIGS